MASTIQQSPAPGIDVYETVPLFQNPNYRPPAPTGISGLPDRVMNAMVDLTLRWTDFAPPAQPVIVIGQVLALKAGVLGTVMSVTRKTAPLLVAASLSAVAMFEPATLLRWIDAVHHGLAWLHHYVPLMPYSLLDRWFDRMPTWVNDMDRDTARSTHVWLWATYFVYLVWSARGPRKVEWLETYLRKHGLEIVERGDFVAARSTVQPVGRTVNLHRRTPTHPALVYARRLRDRIACYAPW